MNVTPHLPIPGIEFDFGAGRVYTIPPLSLGALELLQQRINAMPDLTPTDPQAIATVIDAAHYALKRNYPDLTRAEVADLVDLGNMGDVYGCVMDVAGLRRQELESAAGKAAVKSPSPGASSSPSSAAQPVGPGTTSATV